MRMSVCLTQPNGLAVNSDSQRNIPPFKSQLIPPHSGYGDSQRNFPPSTLTKMVCAGIIIMWASRRGLRIDCQTDNRRVVCRSIGYGIYRWLFRSNIGAYPFFKMRKYKMKKLVLFLLLSVVAVESGYAFIFGGAAWRWHYRRHRRGALYSAEKVVGPPSLQLVRDAVDEQLSLWEYGGKGKLVASGALIRR